jgi:L-seryl-tRNA(Ser) seleniumtransferase
VNVLTIYDKIRVPTVINAIGPVTRLGGSPVDSDVAAVMAEAAQYCVDIGQLQGRASEIISELTGAEAGIVTSGASAGLLLASAACLAGMDLVKMSQLPDTTGMRNEIIVPRTQRNSYDHAVRAAGARLIDAGCSDSTGNIGSCDTEAWELRSAVTERTAAFLYVSKPHWQRSLATVVTVARECNLPVIVDAAAELPPVANLRRFIAEGADLVVFSGGKAIGGPSASGVLCGARTLIASALLQQLDLDYRFKEWNPPASIIDKDSLRGVPRHGIGRSCKLGKEQILGLLTALRKFAAESDDVRYSQNAAIAVSIVRALQELASITAHVITDPYTRIPIVELVINHGSMSADDIAAQLEQGTPPIFVDRSRAGESILMIALSCLKRAEADLITLRLKQILR